jgi:hypothetical protein
MGKSGLLQRVGLPTGVLTVLTGLLAWNGYVHTPVTSEIANLPAGIHQWQSGHFGLNRVNPPLVRAIASAPVLLSEPATDWEHCDLYPLTRLELVVGNDFVRANGARSSWLYTLGRWACIPFSVLGGYVCYRWAKDLYGRAAGGMACVVWCFCPYILGHGALVMSDVPAATLGLTAVYAFWHWLRWPTWMNASVAGIVLGLAELCKFTLLVFYPLLPLLWLAYRASEWRTTDWRMWLREGGMLVAVLVVSVYAINLGYGLEGSFRPLGNFVFKSRMFSGNTAEWQASGNRFADSWMARVRVPLPKNYLQGIDSQRVDFEQGLPSYLRGTWSDHGWWYYYGYALAIKVPLGTWCLFVLAVGVTFFGKGYSVGWRDELLLIAPFLVILIFVSSQTGFSVHSRYAVPALPFLFVWTSKIARVFEMRRFTRKRWVLAVLIVGTLAWSVVSSLVVFPHSLSYFNELAMSRALADPRDRMPMAGRNGERGALSAITSTLKPGPHSGPHHLLDSNIDWGQDLFFLKQWLEQHPEAKLDGLAYYGWYPPALVGIPETRRPSPGTQQRHSPDMGNSGARSTELRESGPQPGWYALSVNHLYDHNTQYRYFLHFEPVAMAGYSIYIYHITVDDANRVRRELGLPELPCD